MGRPRGTRLAFISAGAHVLDLGCGHMSLQRFLPHRIVLEVDQALHELCSGLPGVSQLIPRGEALPAFDFHCPLASLPLAFDTTLGTIP
jgi:hypothetical protein